MDESQKKLTIKKPDEFLKEMKENDREFEDAMSESDAKGIDDLKMLLGEDQWAEDIKTIRTQLKRPMLTQNLLPQFNKQVKNDQRKSRPMIKGIPVDDKSDPKTANVIAGLVRNIWYQSQADAVHDGAFDSVVDCGRAAWRIETQYTDSMSFDQELRVKQIANPFSVRWDLGCKLFDTADKRWCHIEDMISKKEFKRRYPDAEHPNGSGDASSQGTADAGWFTTDGVRIIERWYTENDEFDIVLLSNGQVIKKDENRIRKLMRLVQGLRVVDERRTSVPKIRSCICSGVEILKGPFEFPGEYIPVMIAFGEILNIQGKRHLKSLHRDAKESQQIHNYLITGLVEASALQPNVPFIGTHKMFEKNAEEWKQANLGGKAYLAYEPDPNAPGDKPERQLPAQIPVGLLQMIESNQRNIRAIFGMYESDLGMRSNEKSGKAILAKQEQGDTGTLVFMSNYLYALQFEGRVLVNLIPHYYDAPRSAMITGLEGEHSRVMLNQATQGKDGKPIMYNLKTGKYDVIITTGAGFATQRQETMQAMIDLMQPTMQTNPAAGSVLLMETVKLLDTPNAERLQKAVKATLDPRIQEVLDQDEVGDGGDPQVQAMKQQYEVQMQQVAMQLEQAGVTVQQLQEALKAAEQKLADRSAEMELKAMDQQVKAQESQAKLKADSERTRAEVLIAQIQAQSSEEVKEVRDEIGELAKAVAGVEQAVKALAKGNGKVETAPVAPAPTMQPIVIPIGGGTRKVTVTGPGGKKYTGEVTEGGEEKNESGD
jgi:hypothetical protein